MRQIRFWSRISLGPSRRSPRSPSRLGRGEGGPASSSSSSPPIRNFCTCISFHYRCIHVLLANFLEGCCLVLYTPKADHTGASFSGVADRLVILSALFFHETLRHFPCRFDVLPNALGTQSGRLQVAVFCAFQLPAGQYEQEAQLLLGDRATRKHAKDS